MANGQCGDHLGIEQRMPGHLAVEDAAMPVRPVHHRGHRKPARREICRFIHARQGFTALNHGRARVSISLRLPPDAHKVQMKLIGKGPIAIQLRRFAGTIASSGRSSRRIIATVQFSRSIDALQDTAASVREDSPAVLVEEWVERIDLAVAKFGDHAVVHHGAGHLQPLQVIRRIAELRIRVQAGDRHRISRCVQLSRFKISARHGGPCTETGRRCAIVANIADELRLAPGGQDEEARRCKGEEDCHGQQWLCRRTARDSVEQCNDAQSRPCSANMTDELPAFGQVTRFGERVADLLFHPR